MQNSGGPGTYSEQRDHPRLRMCHHGVCIGEAEVAAWLQHMRRSLDAAALPPEL